MNTITIYNGPNGKRFFLPYHLPVGKSGEFEVLLTKSKRGEKLTVVSMRGALFMGLKPAKLLLEDDTWVHWLRQNGKNGHGTWMSTMPMEIEQHIRQLKDAHGSVLIGGLGLGLAVSLLQNNSKVTDITVCELNEDVITLVKPHILAVERKPTFIVQRDLYKHLAICRLNAAKYDFAFYDIWCPTGQRILTEHVIPLRRASVGVVPQSQIECWNEEEMLGQVRYSCMNVYRMLSDKTERIDVRSRKFRADYRRANPECWPFFNRLCDRLPRIVYLPQLIEQYISALKDPERFDRFWKKWTK